MRLTEEPTLAYADLSELIRHIYAATLTRCWDDFLSNMIELTQSNKAFFLLQKLTEPQPAILNLKINFDYDPAVLRDYYSRPQQDPLYQLIKDFPEGEVIYCNEHVNVDDYANTEYYQSLYKPMRTYYSMGSILIRDGVYDSNFVINRGPTDAPYTEQHKQLLKILTPHLSQAVRIFNTLQLQRDYSNLYQSVMDQCDKAIFVCDAQAKLLLKNAPAERLLLDASILKLHFDQLTLCDVGAHHRFALHIKSSALLAAGDIYCKEAIVLDLADGTSATVTVAPLHGSQDFTRLPQHLCLVSVAISNNLDWQTINREFSLTAAEAKLLQALYRKRKLAELSADFGVSYNTLRSQLQAVFRKLAVNSQIELMVKLNGFTGL